MNIDKDYVICLRRMLHQYPETGFELPRTLALVKAELENIGIYYTEKYGTNSVVGVINPEHTEFTIGLRADMDALRVDEKNDVPYKSKIAGKMHACGHDAHTAILLGTAKALYEMREQISCRVMLLFQPSEEGPESGAERMVADGVMDDIDIILGLHVDGWTESGKIGICKGDSMASQRSFRIEFFGQTAHATLPQTGCDALAAAVRTYNNIHLMLTREVDPFAHYVCSVGKLCAGTTQNVVPDYAEMLGTIRTFDMELDRFLFGKVEKIAKHAADECGVRAEVSSLLNMYNLYNDPGLSDLLIAAAKKVVGGENVVSITPKLSSEDFSQYLTKKPGLLFRLGTRNEKKGITSLPHNNDFQIDEDALPLGCRVFVQFVLDNMSGVNKSQAGDEFAEK